jgi:hypothetical protein
MSLKLYTLKTNDSLINLQQVINQTEQLGYELITFAKGLVQSQNANAAIFRELDPGTVPAGGALTLVPEPGTNLLAQQENDLNARETGGKQLVSYAVVFVQGTETNVAAYRG